ncbi:MAG: hypothetical protein RIS35_408 [Pseudomonadota bacterium]
MCWRLARQLALEHDARVTLVIDRPEVLRAIEPRWITAPGPDSALPAFQEGEAGLRRSGGLVDGVRLELWPDETDADDPSPAPDDPSTARVVVSAFGCELPDRVRRRLRPGGTGARPLWINLEYLSAEDWVAGCHGLSSTKPADGAVEHFFYPGFTPETGGLLRERGVVAQRREFQATGAARRWLDERGLAARPGELLVSMFCYPSSRAAELFGSIASGERAIRVLLPEGVALDAVQRTLDRPLDAGKEVTLGRLTLKRIPLLDQAGYDRLLWSCDLNFVRGEDSWIRAHWAGRPFVWQPYPQSDAAHQKKLAAFLDRFELVAGLAPEIRRMMRAWSGTEALTPVWESYLSRMGACAAFYGRWSDHLGAQPDLAAKLVEFCRNRLYLTV